MALVRDMVWRILSLTLTNLELDSTTAVMWREFLQKSKGMGRAITSLNLHDCDMVSGADTPFEDMEFYRRLVTTLVYSDVRVPIDAEIRR